MNINNEEINNLYELQNYLKQNFNIDVNIRIPIRNPSKITIENIYNKLLINIILLIIFIYLFIKIKKYNILINIILILLLLYILYNILYYLYSIYLYNIIYKHDIDKSTSYKNINFNTGDIIQETTPWYSSYAIYFHILNNKHRYLHGGIIINFKNNNYLLHLMGNSVEYSKPILNFNDYYNLEICPLNNYFKDNYYCTRYYKLFKTNNNNKISNEKLFNILRDFDVKKIVFDTKINIHIPENNDYNDNFNTKYNCLNFIFKILYKLNIIPLFNFQNVLYNDLIFLPNLSNNIYNKEIIIKAI